MTSTVSNTAASGTMRPIRALLVDDEPLARRELTRLLRAHPDVTIVGEAANAAQAEVRLAEVTPDLLFLDVQMPGGSGFDLLERLDDPPPVIFTTAHDEHAVRAFEVAALDYLLKPIEPERLTRALGRFREAFARRALKTEGVLDRLFIRDGVRCWFVPLDEVRLLESDGNYTRVFWRGEVPMLGRALVQLETRLDPRCFFRANRKQLVALPFVRKVELGVGGRLHVELEGGPEVEISRRQARLFRERMGG